jgi:hypothetical protein
VLIQGGVQLLQPSTQKQVNQLKDKLNKLMNDIHPNR